MAQKNESFDFADGVTLRQYLEKIIELNRVADAQALELARAETAAHLLKLNGEAGRLREMQATYLPREEYRLSQTSIVETVGRLELAMAIVSTKADQKELNVYKIVTFVSLGLAVASFVLKIFGM